MTEDTAVRMASALERIAAALEARNAEEGIEAGAVETLGACPKCASDNVVGLFGGPKRICKNCGMSHTQERGA
jgi:uncharacterized protein (DUF983 family)